MLMSFEHPYPQDHKRDVNVKQRTKKLQRLMEMVSAP